MTRAWVSHPHPEHLENEAKLIEFAASASVMAKREYFHGADFDQVVAYAQSLVGQPHS